MRKLYFLTVLLVIGSPAWVAARQASPEPQRAAPETQRANPETQQATAAAQVDEIFSAYDHTWTPGCAVGVIRDGNFVLRRGYGMANLEYGIALSPESVFRIGSTSKQFTAAAVLLLTQEGKLSLDDDVRDYLPELNDFGTPVTIRHLMHHTSGYRDYLTLADLAGLRDDDYYTDTELLEMLSRQRELNFNPGDEHLYSNSGYWLLSQVVERASGKSLKEYAAEKMFAPLGMSATHFHDDHTEIVPHRASGYAPDGDGFSISMTTLPMIGDGGVFTTVDDLLRWDQNFYDSSVGGPEFIEQMLQTGSLNDGEPLTYASGLGVDTYRGLKMVSHAGAFVGFRAEVIRFPDERFSVICLCNRADANPSRLARQVAEVYLGDRMEAQEPRGRRAPRAQPPEMIELSDAALAAFAGDYYSEELDVVYRLSVAGKDGGGGDDDGRIVYEVGSRRGSVQPIGNDVLWGNNLQFRFERDAAGAITGFQIDAGRVKNLRFTRVP